jgi:transposase-like protein
MSSQRIEVVLMDAPALRVNIECNHCHAKASIVPESATADQSRHCPSCGASWVNDHDNVLDRLMSVLREVQLLDGNSLPCVVRFEARRIVREPGSQAA